MIAQSWAGLTSTCTGYDPVSLLVVHVFITTYFNMLRIYSDEIHVMRPDVCSIKIRKCIFRLCLHVNTGDWSSD